MVACTYATYSVFSICTIQKCDCTNTDVYIFDQIYIVLNAQLMCMKPKQL